MLRGRLVLRKDRDLTLEIDVEAPLDWEPGAALVRWADDTVLRAEVVEGRTTLPGR
jgi:hypothetical protein